MGIEIPYEVADGIVLVTLQQHLGILEEQVRACEEDGKFLHPEDYARFKLHLIPAMKEIIEYFGG
jgi:hypothetical protein